MTMRMRHAVMAAIAACFLGASGCTRARRDDTALLAGRVVIDGTPVQKGGIQFMPLDRGQPAFSEVNNGAYSVRAPKGRLRVIFSSVKETGREIEVYSTKVPEVLDALPHALREGVEIVVEGDDPSRDFVLSSKRGKPY